MGLPLKKTFLLVSGASVLGGLGYYYFSRGDGPAIANQIDPEEEVVIPLIPRNRANLKGFDWLKKAETLKNKKSKSDSLNFAIEWANNNAPQVAANWLELICHDPEERITNEDWKEFCEQ